MSDALENLFQVILNKDAKKTQEILQENPSLIYAPNIDDWSAIHICAAYGTKEILKISLQFNANMNQRTAYNYTPLLNVFSY